MQALWQAAHDGGADVVVTGHDHTYERFARLDAGGAVSGAGLRQFVSGLGGRSLHGFGAAKPGSEVRINDVFGVLELTLRAGAYDWRFVAEGGAVRDAGTDSCR